MLKGGAVLLSDNIAKALERIPEENVRLRGIVDDLAQDLQNDIGEKHGNADARLGNEVMIDVDDFAAFAPPEE